jgi:DNA-binding NarL/FixJ family response regulator
MKADQQKRTPPEKKLRVVAADDYESALQHVVSLLEVEVEAAQQTGALGYVFKTHMSQDLVKAVKSAARGKLFVSSRWSGHGRDRQPRAFVH